MTSDPISRRELLQMMAASGLTLGLGLGPDARPIRANNFDALSSFTSEGSRLTQACVSHFWDNSSHLFRAPVLSAETVPSDAAHDRGYTFWPSLIALHALIEGEKHSPGEYTKQIAMVYDGLEQYYSTDLHAYTAWVHFPGNIDAYYDDNSWAVIVLTEAFQACRATDAIRAAGYLARARAIMADFVVKGEDHTSRPGGVRWGCDPSKPNTSDRGTSSTAGSALAALMLARAGVEKEFYTQWGYSLLTWLSTHLLDTDGLVMDALAGPNWAVRKIKWTYNTGVPMRAYIEHYRLTKSPASLAMASKLARAAINPRGALYDQNVHDSGKRFYWDSIYFVHYLVDGLLQVALVTPDAALAKDTATTITRSAAYAHSFLRDPIDGFYWRNFRLYAIGTAQHAVWQKWTGQSIVGQYDASERSQEARYQALAVQDRPLVKTLLANAAAARLFWLTARLPKTHSPFAPLVV